MIPKEGLPCPPPWECPGALPRCRACDANSAGCPGLTFALCPQLPGIAGVCLLASWVLFPELKWCLVKPSPSRAAGGQQAGENVPGGRGGVPFSQRTQGAHSGRERLHVCVWEQGGGLGAGGWPGLRCGPPTDRRAEAPPRQVWGDRRGCPGRGCPDGRVGEEEPQPGPKVGAWGLRWVEGSRHGAGEGGHVVRPSRAPAVRRHLTQLSASSERRPTDPRGFCPGGTFQSGEEEQS